MCRPHIPGTVRLPKYSATTDETEQRTTVANKQTDKQRMWNNSTNLLDDTF